MASELPAHMFFSMNEGSWPAHSLSDGMVHR